MTHLCKYGATSWSQCWPCVFSGLAHPEQSVRHHRRRQQGQHRQQAVEQQHRLCVGQVLLFAHLGISFTRSVQVPQFWQPLFTNHDQQLLKVSYLDLTQNHNLLKKTRQIATFDSNSEPTVFSDQGLIIPAKDKCLETRCATIITLRALLTTWLSCSRIKNSWLLFQMSSYTSKDF